jgi:hypothetical protein
MLRYTPPPFHTHTHTHHAQGIILATLTSIERLVVASGVAFNTDSSCRTI